MSKAYITHDNYHNRNVVNGIYPDQTSADDAASGNYKVYAAVGGYDIPEAVQVQHARYDNAANTIVAIDQSHIDDLGKLHGEIDQTIAEHNYWDYLIRSYQRFYKASTIETALSWTSKYRRSFDRVSESSRYTHNKKIAFFQNSRK